MEVLQYTNRPETCGSYYGPGVGEHEAPYVPGEYMPSNSRFFFLAPVSCMSSNCNELLVFASNDALRTGASA